MAEARAVRVWCRGGRRWLAAVSVLVALFMAVPAAAAGPVVGPSFRIDDNLPTWWSPSVACSSSRGLCMVAWASVDKIVRYRMVSEAGGVLGSASTILGEGYSPDVAYNAASDQFLVVWTHDFSTADTDIVGARIGGDGSGEPGFVNIDASSQLDFDPKVTAAGSNGFLIVFHRLGQIVGHILSASGSPDDLLADTFYVGTEGELTTAVSVAYSPAISAYVVAYRLSGMMQTQLLSTSGALLGPASQVYSDMWPALAGSATDAAKPFLLASVDYDREPAHVRFLGPDGAALGSPATLAIGGYLAGLAAAAGTAAYVVAWSQMDPVYRIWVRLVRPDGTLLPTYLVSGETTEQADAPAVATGLSRSLIVWRQSNPSGPSGIYGAFAVSSLVFAGHVYEVSHGGAGAPLAGVTVQLLGDSDASVLNGASAALGSDITRADGAYDLSYNPTNYAYPYYHVVETDPAGAVSVGSAAISPGTPNPANSSTLTYTAPSELGYYFGGAFFDLETPPQARFTVAPPAGPSGQPFTFDARGTTDGEEQLGALTCRWDWTGDGAYDTDWGQSFYTQHSYRFGGTYTVRFQVRDSSGLVGEATGQVVVSWRLDQAQVCLPLVVYRTGR